MPFTESIKPQIAVLEDHEDTRELLRIVLEADFNVQAFGDARDVLAALEREMFSAVVADIMLPGLDGYGFIKAVRTNPHLKQLCVIAVTALAMTGDRERAMAAGFTDYLIKPVAPEIIVARVWECLRPEDAKEPPAA